MATVSAQFSVFLLFFYQFFPGFQWNLHKRKQFKRCRRIVFIFEFRYLSKEASRYLLFLEGAGIDRLFELRVESRLIRSVIINWSVGHFLDSILKGHFYEKSMKTVYAEMISCVTLTGCYLKKFGKI